MKNNSYVPPEMEMICVEDMILTMTSGAGGGGVPLPDDNFGQNGKYFKHCFQMI